MKKILLSVFALLTVFVLTGCVEIATTTTTEPLTTTTSGDGPVSKVVMDLPDEEVTILFWHIYGAGKTALLDKLIDEFEAMYPNVTIESQSQSDYNTLREKINTGIGVGQVPTMALGYPDHFAGYVQAGAAYSLNNFIYSNIQYEVTDSTSTIFGDLVDVSLDLEDFVPGYLAENNQYVGGQYYSMPYSKSTETMAINRTIVKNHVAAIRAAGIEVSDEGFFSHTTPLTFSQIQTLGTILLNETATTDVANYQCGYLLNYDSSGNMYINMSRQWSAPYTNSTGAILINNNTTKSMLNYINAMFNNRTYVLPVKFGQAYGSTNFKYGDICMTVGSTAGVLYNIPTSEDVQANLKFGLFDVDFLQVPQPTTTAGSAVTLSDGTNNYNLTGQLSSVQQGPNIGIFKKASANEKLFAWLFIKYLTTAENTALWAMDTGYLPVRLSAYTSDVMIKLTPTFSTTYVDFLKIATDFWTLDGKITKRDTVVSDYFKLDSQWEIKAVDNIDGLGSFSITNSQPSDLLISKYIEGNGANQAIEIYNGTGADVDLSKYSLVLYANGSKTVSSSLTLSGTLANGDVFVVYNTDATLQGIKDAGDLANNTVMNFDGNDVLALKKDTLFIDSIGQTEKTNNFAQNVTLVRYSTTTWDATDERWDYLHSSMVANIAKNQALYYQYDPAFPAGSSSAGSATVRVEAGYCLENIYNKAKTPTEALSFFLNQVDW